MANAGSGGVPRGAPVQPTSQQDYYKSLVPSQLLAERGEEIVVINPGSANVRIGLASAKAPVSVPHCIAHQLRMSGNEQDSAELPKKGAVGEDRFGTSSLSAARVDEREDALELVVSQLKLRSFFSDAKAGAGDSNSCELLSKERDTGFEWTNVEENSAGRSIPRTQKSSMSNDRTDDSRAGERAQEVRDDIHEIEDRLDTDVREFGFNGALETKYDDDEGLMTDLGTPDTPQEEFLQDAQELVMNLDETERGSDDEVLGVNSGSPQTESSEDVNELDEIKDMNVDGPVDDPVEVLLGDGQEGGEKSLDVGEKFVAPFPITRVKRIIKLDKDVRLVTGDAIALIAQAAALFVQNLSSASFTVMLRTKRKTIRGAEVVLAAKSTRQFRECLGNDLATLLEESNGDTAIDEDGPVDGASDEPVRTRPQEQKSAKKRQLAAPPGSRPITNFFKA